ncbi:MAG: four helix bundle protein [Patiriisocius sp.]
MKYELFFMRRIELEERMISFSVMIIELSGEIRFTIAGKNLSSQIVRSGTSVSLNYGEAQSVESRKYFLHKMKIIAKELRETYVNLRILHWTKLCKNDAKIQKALKENNELTSIFVSSIMTAEKNVKVN